MRFVQIRSHNFRENSFYVKVALACVAWRFWLDALNNKGGRRQRNREECARFCGFAAQSCSRQNRHATQAKVACAMIASLNCLLGMSRTTEIPQKVYVFTRAFFYFHLVKNEKNRVVEQEVVSVVVKRWIDNCSRHVLQNANLSFFIFHYAVLRKRSISDHDLTTIDYERIRFRSRYWLLKHSDSLILEKNNRYSYFRCLWLGTVFPSLWNRTKGTDVFSFL